MYLLKGRCLFGSDMEIICGFRPFQDIHPPISYAQMRTFRFSCRSARAGLVAECLVWKSTSEIAADGACRKTSLNRVCETFSIRWSFPYDHPHANAK